MQYYYPRQNIDAWVVWVDAPNRVHSYNSPNCYTFYMVLITISTARKHTIHILQEYRWNVLGEIPNRVAYSKNIFSAGNGMYQGIPEWRSTAVGSAGIHCCWQTPARLAWFCRDCTRSWTVQPEPPLCTVENRIGRNKAKKIKSEQTGYDVEGSPKYLSRVSHIDIFVHFLGTTCLHENIRDTTGPCGRVTTEPATTTTKQITLVWLAHAIVYRRKMANAV